jgi:hypothetical protein
MHHCIVAKTNPALSHTLSKLPSGNYALRPSYLPQAIHVEHTGTPERGASPSQDFVGIVGKNNHLATPSEAVCLMSIFCSTAATMKRTYI